MKTNTSLLEALEKREFLLEIHDAGTGALVTKLNYDYNAMCGFLKILKPNVRVTVRAREEVPKRKVQN